MASLSSLSDLQIEDIMYRLDYIEAYRLASTNSHFLRIFDRIKNRLAYRDLGYLNKLEKYKRNKKYFTISPLLICVKIMIAVIKEIIIIFFMFFMPCLAQ